MSFNSDVKQELQLIKLNEDVANSELLSFIRANASVAFMLNGYQIIFQTENNPVARRIFSILKLLYDYDAPITVNKSTVLRKRNIYILRINEKITEYIFNDLGIDNLFMISSDRKIQDDLYTKSLNQKSSYLRSAFMLAGYIYDPNKWYQIDITSADTSYLKFIAQLLDKFNIKARILEKNDTSTLYLKDSDKISDFLSLIGAHNAVLELENIRAFKDIKNNVNRRVNFDTANLSRTVSASSKQIEMIQRIDEVIGLDNLDDGIKEIAKLRLENMEMSAKELGEIADPQLSKSAVNYRLRKLKKIYEML